LLAVVNAGKVRPLVLVRRCCSSSCVHVGLGSLPAATDSDRSLASEGWGISIVALPFRLARITSHRLLLPASTPSLTFKNSIILHSPTCFFLDRLLAALDSVPHLTAVVAFDLGPVLEIAKSLAKTPKKVDGPRV
jgi:hypothetical protein